MNKLTLLFASLFVGSLVACAADAPSDPNSGGGNAAKTAAKQLFNSNVFPIFSAKCASSGCHAAAAGSPGFVAATADETYAIVDGDTRLVGALTSAAAAPLLTKVAPGHNGATYSGDESGKITAWLEKEIEARATGSVGGTGETAAQLTDRLLKEFSGCMTQADWDAENVTTLYATWVASTGQCIGCHANGEFGFLVTADSTTHFAGVSGNKDRLLKYFTVDVSAKKVVVNLAMYERIGSEAGAVAHPNFTVPAPALDALAKFYGKAAAGVAAKACGAPKI